MPFSSVPMPTIGSARESASGASVTKYRALVDQSAAKSRSRTPSPSTSPKVGVNMAGASNANGGEVPTSVKSPSPSFRSTCCGRPASGSPRHVESTRSTSSSWSMSAALTLKWYMHVLASSGASASPCRAPRSSKPPTPSFTYRRVTSGPVLATKRSRSPSPSASKKTAAELVPACEMPRATASSVNVPSPWLM